jgi:YVTN family beta-propeller protein
VAFGPHPLAADPFAYVSNQASNNVSVIDTATNTVVDTVGVGGIPWGVAITPDGARAYVANTGSNNVSVINTATNTVSATVPVGNFPIGVAITPDGARAYVANTGSNNVSVINTATNTVSATVPVGSFPVGVAITPDGARAYVANGGPNNVSVINTATNTVSANVPVGSWPFGVAITPLEKYQASTVLCPWGVLEIAVLTTEELYAEDIDAMTVEFGGASPVHCRLKDVNDDGDPDLLCQFKRNDLNLTDSDKGALLTGETYDGVLVEGVNRIYITQSCR